MVFCCKHVYFFHLWIVIKYLVIVYFYCFLFCIVYFVKCSSFDSGWLSQKTIVKYYNYMILVCSIKWLYSKEIPVVYTFEPICMLWVIVYCCMNVSNNVCMHVCVLCVYANVCGCVFCVGMSVVMGVYVCMCFKNDQK